MWHGFGGAGDERILRRVSGWICLLDMGRGVDGYEKGTRSDSLALKI